MSDWTEEEEHPNRVRHSSDENFEHCAVTLLPFAVEFCRSLEVGQKIDWNGLNCIKIAAEVAEALARDKYGKPKFRVHARSDRTSTAQESADDDWPSHSDWVGA